MAKKASIERAARDGKIVTLSYNKKTTGTTVVRDVGIMQDAGDFYYAQHQGQIKKFIKSRIVKATPSSEPFSPAGGYESDYASDQE